jgi:hypothetical protein
MKSFVFIAIILTSLQGRSQIFTESIGTIVGTTAIAVHEAANGFDNDAYTMSGSGDLRATTVSSGYAGASGAGNVFITNIVNKDFQIAGINTTTCNSLSLSFGAYKSSTANMSDLILEYSTDGAVYNAIAFPAQPTGAGTAVWRLVTVSLPVGAENQANLRLRWKNSNTTTQFRLDDVTLNGTCVTNTISTSNVTGGPFTVDCSTTDTGTIDFTSTGTFAVGNIFTAQLSNSAGSFASPINIGTLSGALAENLNPGSSINIIIPAGTATGAAYRIRVISSNPATIGTNNGVDISITNTACLNTITTGAITGSPFGVTCTTPATGSIAFTSSGTFTAGNTYTAQLSNASGSFASPTIIGSLASTANSGSILISIPSGTATGAGYLIRIISTTPSVTGSSSVSFTITLSGGPCALEPPHLTSVIINSCNGLCSEGNNEIVFGTSGGYSFTANTANFDFLYGSSYPGTNYTDVLVSNATRINELNAAAGCGTLFVDAVGGIVPANANWMLVSTTICAEALTWTGLCGLGPIYVVFQNDASWNLIGGNFVNSPAIGDMRYYQTSITTTLGSTFTIDYTTDDSYPDSDGVFAAFDSNGGTATSYGDNNCILTPTVLPTGLINYNGNYINSKSELTWQTASEQNNSHFTLSHSTDGYQFNVIGTVMGAGNSSDIRDYRFIHNFPHPGMNYYKLKSTDYDGKEYSKGIVAIEAEFNFSFYNSITSTIELSYESDIEIFSMDGKLIQSSLNTSSVPFTKSGMFFIYDKKTGISERLFIP